MKMDLEFLAMHVTFVDLSPMTVTKDEKQFNIAKLIIMDVNKDAKIRKTMLIGIDSTCYRKWLMTFEKDIVDEN